jgi:hypothetical protein
LLPESIDRAVSPDVMVLNFSSVVNQPTSLMTDRQEGQRLPQMLQCHVAFYPPKFLLHLAYEILTNFPSVEIAAKSEI